MVTPSVGSSTNVDFLLHFIAFSVYESVKATDPDVDGLGLNPRTDVSSNQYGPLSKALNAALLLISIYFKLMSDKHTGAIFPWMLPNEVQSGDEEPGQLMKNGNGKECLVQM